MRTPFAVLVALLAVLVPVAFLIDDGGGEAAAPAPAPVEVVAERVERLRGLEFERPPEPERVSARTAVREGLADLDRGYPAAARRADEALYTLLGLLPAGTDLREVTASVFGEGVAGYYDPRTGRLRVVEGAGSANRVVAEMVLAHELTHALEDQVFGLDLGRAEAAGDAGYAYRALVEGTATAAMLEYAGAHFRAEEALGGLLASALSVSSSEPLPPFVQAGLVWPYLAGERFVAELYRRAGRSWRLVDVALRARPPASTEQVLHPEKWLSAEVPEPVALRGARAALGPGFRRLAAGTFGEWQTGQLVRGAGAVTGWAGDRYALWRRGTAACDTPCTGRDALLMRWRWDGADEARRFEAALAAAAIPAARAVARRGREVTLAVGPGAIARRLLRSVSG